MNVVRAKRRETCISITPNGKVVPLFSFPVSALCSVLFIWFHFPSLFYCHSYSCLQHTKSHPISFRFVCFSVFPSFIWVERTSLSLHSITKEMKTQNQREREGKECPTV